MWQLSPELRFDEKFIEAVAAGSKRIAASLREIERGATLFDQRYYQPIARVAHPETIKREGGSVLEIIQAAIGLFQLLNGRRFAEHLSDLIWALNRRRLYTAALVTRALIELASSIVYVEVKVTSALRSGIRTQEDLRTLLNVFERAVRGGTIDWARWLMGGETRRQIMEEYAEGKRPRASLMQARVGEMKNFLDERLAASSPESKGLIHLIYGILSDICHPSAGAQLLQLANRPTEGWWVLEPSPSDEMIRWYCLNTTVPLVESIGKAAAHSLSNLTRIAQNLRAEEKGE